MDKISVIVPCYNEESALPFFYQKITEIAAQIPAEFEFLFVDDGSRDGTLALAKQYAQKDARVKYVSFSRNFGKEAAMFAGLEQASGDYVCVMDADLQDPPEFLVQMYDRLRTGECDCVAARRVSRENEPPVRSFFARMFYRLINKISKVEIVDGARDFRLMTRAMTDAVRSMQEYNRFSKGLFSYAGFRTEWIEYQNVNRVSGETKWSFWSLFRYSIEGIVGFSTAPLIIPFVLSGLSGLAFFGMLIAMIVGAATGGVSGTLVLACLMALFSCAVLLSLGILGSYLARAYTEVKKRPIYIIREKN